MLKTIILVYYKTKIIYFNFNWYALCLRCCYEPCWFHRFITTLSTIRRKVTVMESFRLKNFIFSCLSVAVVVISALFLYEPVQNVLCDYAIFERFLISIPSTCSLFDTKRLSRYNGADGGKIYLSILGTIFDVTDGRRFYGPGGTYHGFAGQ